MVNPFLEFFFGGFEDMEVECHECWKINEVRHKVNNDKITFTCTFCDRFNSYE